uniref:NAD-dependent epimerase/dehydratase family protein n=1 Tax=Phenylobacterium glaciei TaxID=2803784 RepID=A0A974P667_9CAUL|nr:NAD-dependent epimerase/dehydratase family protein [Phenylobacterium glaciei]
MSRRAFILGGSGQIGRATALNLLDAGWDVTVGQRHGELPAVLQGRVTVTALDRADDTALTDALSTPSTPSSTPSPTAPPTPASGWPCRTASAPWR